MKPGGRGRGFGGSRLRDYCNFPLIIKMIRNNPILRPEINAKKNFFNSSFFMAPCVIKATGELDDV